MIIRKIQLISNIYKYTKSTDKTPLGSYCVFGPFDALDIDSNAEDWINQGGQVCGEKEESTIMSWCDGKSSRCNIICAFQNLEEEKEREFIERCKYYPYLFISLLLLSHDNKDSVIERAKTRMKSINARNDLRAYFSLGKNEIVLLHYCKNYSEGLKQILKEHKEFSLTKVSTVFAVQENALTPGHNLYKEVDKKELVSCRLHGVMRDREKAENFLNQLGARIMNISGAKAQLIWYDVLGGADILVEIDDMLLADLLPLYESGEILTHMNDCYNNAWYNIETVIISKKKGVNYGEEYRKRQQSNTGRTEKAI